MITPSYGLTATERVLPNLALDFTTASLDGRVTFARTGATATRVNASGFIESVAANTARFDFDPVNLLCQGLLIEESRTNQFLYSSDLRNTATAGAARPWNYVNASVNADIANSPDGTQNADKIEETSATGEHAIFHDNYAASNVTLSVSIFAKADERNKINLVISDFATGGASCVFDLSLGTAGAASSSTAEYTSPVGKIINYGDGWYRCVLTVVKGSGNTNNYAVFNLNNGSTINYAGTTGHGLFAFGAQLEAGAFATSYIPTTTTAVTRNADVATVTGTNFSNFFNATEGTFGIEAYFLDANTLAADRKPLFYAGDGVSNVSNVFEIGRQENNGNPYMRAMTYSGGATQTSFNMGLSTGQPVSAVMGYKVDSVSGAINGNNPVSDTSATMPVGIDQLRLGSNTTIFMSGWVRSFRYWPQRLINNEIRAFSK
jgi:hypothetical protein